MNEKYVENCQEDENGFVALTGEDGSVERFFHVGTIDYKNDWYVFFQPSQPKDGIDPDELVIFKLSGDEKNETLLPINDENLISELYDVFMVENADDDEINEEIDCASCQTSKNGECGSGCEFCAKKSDL